MISYLAVKGILSFLFSFLLDFLWSFVPHYVAETRIDIETGKVIHSRRVPYFGKWAFTMPNARPSRMKSNEDLQLSITPMVPGQGERVPWTWFHRQTYTSGTTTQLTFFQATGVITTTNMQAAGQIPAPMFFDLYHIGVYFDLPTSSVNAAGTLTVNTGAMTDLTNILDGVLTFKVAQKDQFISPIWQLPAGAGPSGALAAAGTFTAEDYNLFQQGTNGVPDLRNRYNFWGDVTIPHNQNFSVIMDWAAAVTLQAGNTDIITYLDGYLYRRVL